MGGEQKENAGGLRAELGVRDGCHDPNVAIGRFPPSVGSKDLEQNASFES